MTREVQTTDVELQEDLVDILQGYPHLRAALPPTYPHGRSFEVTVTRLEDYSDDRLRRFFHQLNLPLALHVSRHSESEDVRDLMTSLLRLLDRFWEHSSALPGARTLLAPLWEDAWSTTPEIWSIASCVFLADRLKGAGWELKGFEQLIGSGPRDADLTLRVRGGLLHVDVEAWHTADFGARNDDEVRAALERRAAEKVAKKFRDLPPGEAGVVAEVAVISVRDADRSVSALQDPIELHEIPNTHWLPLRLVGVRSPRLEFRLVNF